MAYKFAAEKAEKLESEDRYERLQPVRRLRQAGMAPGQQVLDVGTGTGFYTRAAADIVGEQGKVVGTDILPEMLEKARSMGAPENVSFQQAGESTFPVGDGVMDWVIMTNLFHELEEPDKFIGEIRRVLRPGGRVYYTDWIPQEEDDGPPKEHRLDKSVAEEVFGRHGLHVRRDGTVGPSHYEIIFEKS